MTIPGRNIPDGIPDLDILQKGPQARKKQQKAQASPPGKGMFFGMTIHE